MDHEIPVVYTAENGSHKVVFDTKIGTVTVYDTGVILVDGRPIRIYDIGFTYVDGRPIRDLEER